MNRSTATATATNLALAAIIAVGSLSALAVADPPLCESLTDAIRKDDEERALCRAVRAGRMSCPEARQRILEWKP